jgi:hypothetical protein
VHINSPENDNNKWILLLVFPTSFGTRRCCHSSRVFFGCIDSSYLLRSASSGGATPNSFSSRLHSSSCREMPVGWFHHLQGVLPIALKDCEQRPPNLLSAVTAFGRNDAFNDHSVAAFPSCRIGTTTTTPGTAAAATAICCPRWWWVAMQHQRGTEISADDGELYRRRTRPLPRGCKQGVLHLGSH